MIVIHDTKKDNQGMYVHNILQLVNRYASPGSIISIIYISSECAIHGTMVN